MTDRGHDTPRDDAAKDAAARRTESDTGAIEPGRPPGSEYENPADALTPSAGPGAGATGPGGTGRSDMRDIGDAAAAAGRRYGSSRSGPDGNDDDIRAAAGGIPRPSGFDTGIPGQVSHTLFDKDDEVPDEERNG